MRMLFGLLALVAVSGGAPVWADASGTPYAVEGEARPAAAPAAKHTAKPAAAPAVAAAKPAADAKPPANPPLPRPAPNNASIQLAAKPPAAAALPDKSIAPAVAPRADALNGVAPDERVAIESALLWSGDFAGVPAGDDPLTGAIRSFQKRNKSKITGTLTVDERAKLVAATREREQDYGWNIVVDPATGIRLGLPAKFVPHARDTANGTRWSSAHGDVQVETFRIKNTSLAAVFEQEKKVANRKIESSALHPADFAITGMQGLKIMVMRAQARDGEVRGFTLMFDQAIEGIVTPVMSGMTNAFTPFPERGAPFATTARPVDYGTGLIISGLGHIVTDRNLIQGCQVIVAAGLGNAERVADDPASGLALLRIYGARKLTPLPLSNAAPKSGDVTLVGIPDPKEQDGRKALTEIKGRLSDGGAIELRSPVPMAGLTGAAAFDAGGNFLGMMELRSAVLASAGPAAPPVRLVPAQTIRAFLEARDVAPTPAQGADAQGAVVRVICVRK